MGLLPEGEIIRVRRTHALIPLITGLVFTGIGVGITRLMITRGDAGPFLFAWGSLWFVGSGAALVSGLRGVLRPRVFAMLTQDSATFVAQRIRPVPWRDLVAVRSGLRTVTRRNKTEMALRTPLILTVRDVNVLNGEWLGGKFRHPGHPMDDGTAEILLKTGGCPLTNDALIRKLSERAGFAPDLRPADPATATLGGVKLNQPSGNGLSLCAGSAVLLVFGLILAGVGGYKIREARASRHWLPVPAEVISATTETRTRSSAHGSSTTRTPRITYRYEVAGQSYTGNRAAFFYPNGSAGDFIRRFPPGKPTTAYYDPQNPSAAVLVREGRGRLWILVAFGAFFAAVGGWLLHRLLDARRAPLKNPGRAKP